MVRSTSRSARFPDEKTFSPRCRDHTPRPCGCQGIVFLTCSLELWTSTTTGDRTDADVSETISQVDPAMRPRDSRRATMKDVAALANVSLSTVSRVVNDDPAVNPDLA